MIVVDKTNYPPVTNNYISEVKKKNSQMNIHLDG